MKRCLDATWYRPFGECAALRNGWQRSLSPSAASKGWLLNLIGKLQVVVLHRLRRRIVVVGHGAFFSALLGRLAAPRNASNMR